MFGLCKAVTVISLSLSVAYGASTQCDQDNKCPSEAPCCSAYGQCGVGAYCLGGCDPRASYSLQSCSARPTCANADFTFDNLDGMQANTIYLGDATKANWVTEGTPVAYDGDTLLLTMAESTVGTLLSSTHYVWYGKISATMRTSAGQGVVTAFIMMSDVKDEIDFEFVGNDLNVAQSNFYWQGVDNYTNAIPLNTTTTNTEWHTYEIDWQEDSLTWSIDGNVMRTLNRDATINSTTGKANYPQTPARIMISLWPAGLSSNGEGTIEWAGGLIDWNSQYMSNGYYYAQLKDVSVTCASTPSDAKASGSKSFMYTDYSGLEDSVAITNDNTVLASFFANGENAQYNPDSSSTAKGSTASATPVPSNVQTVPGVVGGGVRGGTDNADGSGSTLSGAGNGDADPQSGGDASAFSQGLDNKAPNGKNERAVQGSALAIFIAFFALIAL